MHDLARDLIDRFAAWALDRDDIRAAVVIGSQARSDRPADALSDLDLLVFTTDPAALLDSDAWVAEFGLVILTCTEPTLGGTVERRVRYASGLQVDFPILPVAMLDITRGGTPDGQGAEFMATVATILGRGFRTVLDKDGRLAGLSDFIETASPGPPDPLEFATAVDDFWFHALWTARKLRRGEALVAKSCCDGTMKGDLIAVARWQARSRGGVDTWHQGRFFEEWADPRLIAELRTCFARYDEQDIGHALLATMRTFDWLARETAILLGFDYPDAAVRWITGQVDETLVGKARGKGDIDGVQGQETGQADVLLRGRAAGTVGPRHRGAAGRRPAHPLRRPHRRLLGKERAGAG